MHLFCDCDCHKDEEHVEHKLERLEELMGAGIFALAMLIVEQGENMSAELDSLTQNVSDLTGTANLVVSLVNDLNAKVDALQGEVDAGADPAAIQAAADAVKAANDALTAVLAPAAPVEPPVEEPVV